MRRLLACLSILPAAAVLAASAAAPAVPTGKLPADAAPLHYALHFSVDPRQPRFSGEARIRVRLARAADVVWLHAQEMEIRKAGATDAAGYAVAAKAILHADAGVLELRLAQRLPAQEVELAFEWDAPFNARLEGVYKVVVGDDAYAVTQMEPVSARLAFPGFDEPRFKVPFDLSLTVPVQDVAVANTRRTGEAKSADAKSKTLTFATTAPLPTYLVAFAVGPWDVVEAPPIPANAVRRTQLPLRGIGPRGSRAKFGWALETAAAIVPLFEEYTAQPYPFDKLDLLGAPDFAAGAMENAGLIVYRDAYLLTDAHSAAERYRGVFDINAHEIAHQWYGDLVTVPWWDDIWLNEAWATWAQRKATAALHPEYRGDLGALEAGRRAMRSDSLLGTRKVRQPIRGRGDIETAFDGITYSKGAAVLAMFERWLGETRFRDAIRAYLAQRAFGSGSSDDLVAGVAGKGSDAKPVAAAMRSFLDQPGIPLVSAALDCGERGVSLQLAQTRYLPYGVLAADTPTWGVPVCSRFGRGDASTTQCFLLERANQRFDVAGGCPDWLLPNADARGYYRFELAPPAFARLGAAFARLTPAERIVYADAVGAAFARGTLAADALLDAMPALAGSDLPQVATALLDSFGWIREHLADAATRASLERWAAQLYAVRAQQLGWRRRAGESPDATALRTRLAEFLALDLRDPAARAELAQQGRAALGLDGGGRPDLTRADADLLAVTLKVAVQDGGAPAFDAAQAAFRANRDTAQRYALVEALGATRDARLGERARDLGLTSDVQVGEMSRLYSAQAAEPENRAPLWQWLQRNFEAYRLRLPPAAQARVPELVAEGRCGEVDADELAAWFAPRVGDLIGGERGLGQALERVRQCGALRAHADRKALADWVAAHGRPR